MSDTILTITDLRKQYGIVKALDGLSLEVKQGEVFGLLGPNGSGKTTTLGILLGITKAKSGSFSWFNNGQSDANRKRIGAILEQPNFYPFLSAFQNLKVSAEIRNVQNPEQRIPEILEWVGLKGREFDKFKTYSLGMKQRLAIASALLHDPEVLVLDEPTNGLDPQGIADIRELIREIAASGKTIIIASHILDEIEKICSHVAILRKGKLLSYGPLEEIIGEQQSVSVACSDLSLLKGKLESIPWATLQQDEGNVLRIGLTDDKTNEDLNRWCFDQGIVLTEIRSGKRNLESIFLETVKKS